MLAVGPGVKTGMPIRYDNPREIGPDRLVNAVAAHARLGGPCVVVDFGTAITYDPVSADGRVPRGHHLPRRRDLPGGADRARRGAAAGRRHGAPRADRQDHDRRDPLGHRVRNRGPGRRDRAPPARGAGAGQTKTIATGGLARAIVPYTTTIEGVDDLLTLTGLRLIYERNRA